MGLLGFGCCWGAAPEAVEPAQPIWDWSRLAAIPPTSGTNFGSAVVPWIRKGIVAPLQPPLPPPIAPRIPPIPDTGAPLEEEKLAEFASVAAISKSRSWPVFRPVSAEMVDILDPRSKPASFALKRPTVPVVISLLVGPAISRLALRVPAASEAPFGRLMPRAGRKASRSRAGMFSALTFALTTVASPAES